MTEKDRQDPENATPGMKVESTKGELGWQSEGFYLILTAALVVGLVLTFLGVNPIQLIFWSNIVTAIIAPLLVIAILLLGNHRTIMKDQRLSLLHNFWLVLTVLILIAAAVLFFYGLATGQGGS